MKKLMARVFTLSALTALALGFASASQAEEIFHIKKSEARCESPQVCMNPIYEMTCSFQSNGAVLISKFYITGMASPAWAIPAPNAFLPASDLTQLNALISSFLKSGPQQTKAAPGRTYHYAGVDYASSDRYVVPAKERGAEDAEVAMFFKQFGEISSQAEAEELVKLSDKYCDWMFLTLTK
ncbi:MAG: hypothetical protein ACXWQO_03685 [Bdellovibrionota bacterium]